MICGVQENNVSCMQLHCIYSALIFIIHFLYIESLSLMDRMKIKVPNNEVEKESRPLRLNLLDEN